MDPMTIAAILGPARRGRGTTGSSTDMAVRGRQGVSGCVDDGFVLKKRGPRAGGRRAELLLAAAGGTTGCQIRPTGRGDDGLSVPLPGIERGAGTAGSAAMVTGPGLASTGTTGTAQRT